MIFEVGKHRLQHGSVADDLGILMNGEKADIMYVDPPWGQEGFDNYNKENEGSNIPNESLSLLLLGIFRNADKYLKQGAPIFMEYRSKYREALIMVPYWPFFHQGFCEVHWSGETHDLHLFSTEIIPFPNGVKGPSDAIDLFSVKDGIVLDPCCGSGKTAQSIYGMRFYGNDINLKRVEETKQWLDSHR